MSINKAFWKIKNKIIKRSSIRFSMVERINYCFSDPFKKHNNAIESVKETENQFKEAAPISDFLSSYKGDNSPPKPWIFQGFLFFWISISPLATKLCSKRKDDMFFAMISFFLRSPIDLLEI